MSKVFKVKESRIRSHGKYPLVVNISVSERKSGLLNVKGYGYI